MNLLYAINLLIERAAEKILFDGPEVKHVSPANPYDNNLRHLAIEACKELGITVHEKGTAVVTKDRFQPRQKAAGIKNGLELLI